MFALADVMGHADIRQTREYVQQTPTARARVITALGQAPPLAVIHGAAGANPAADHSQQPSSDTLIEADENAS